MKSFSTSTLSTIIPILLEEVAGYQTPVVDLIAVQTQDPFKVLIATILSARTKDEVTAKASKRLFKKAPNIAALEKLTTIELETLIYPVGFFRNKAKSLAKLPRILKEQFKNNIPTTVDELTELPGVGRKTANLVVSVAFDKPAICVDTHVHRIMNIWGYVQTKTPLETEMALREKLPPQYWKKINSMLVAFGQGTCLSVRPHCDRCVIEKHCPQLGVTPRKVGGVEKKSESNPNMLKFISWNVNGIRAIEKKDFVNLVHELSPDILAIQETRAQLEQLSEKLKNIDGYISYWFSAEKKGYSGVGIYCKQIPENVIYGIGEEQFDSEGRVITVEFEDYFLINAYFPNSQHGLKRIQYKLDFNKSLNHFVTKLSLKKSVVICGDYNVAHRSIDLANPKANEKNPGFSPQERAWMDSFISSGYVDTFRKFNREPHQYTWWSYRFNAREKNIGWRIDYFCVDKASEHQVIGAEIHKDILGSDHCPVSIDFVNKA